MEHDAIQLEFDVKFPNGTKVGKTQVYIHNDYTGAEYPKLVIANRLDEGNFFRKTSGTSNSGKPYVLPNKITLLEQLDGPDGNLVREWIEDTTEDCGINGGASAVEFTITPDLVQCPYDNGFRQYVRVWDQLFVGDKPCDDYQFKDKVYNRQADEIASNTYDFSLECCQCEFTYEPPHEPEEPTRPPLPPLPPRKPKMPPSPNRPPRPPDPPRPVSRRRPRHW